MKKILFAVVALWATLVPANVVAQNLLELLSKGKEVVKSGKKLAEQVGVIPSENKKKVAPSVTVAVPTPAASPSGLLNGGVEVINPLAPYIQVAPVGLYGITKSENYGDVYLVMKVYMSGPFQNADFGSTSYDEKMLAVDADGNVYGIYSSGSKRFDIPEGIPVKVVMDDVNYRLQDVRRNVNVMPVVKVGVFIDAKHRGQLTFRNLPVYWDQAPE